MDPFRRLAAVISFLAATCIVGCHNVSPTPPSTKVLETVVAIPARAGAVVGKKENSDAFLWELFVTQIAVPVVKGGSSPAAFETWASDADTFSVQPHWPKAGDPVELQPSFLGEIRSLGADTFSNVHNEVNILPKARSANQASTKPTAKSIDVDCKVPNGAAVGSFPTGDKSLCIAEQVGRNYPMWHYIVSNNLNTQAGLKDAYEKGITVEMPTDAIAIKADWVPLEALVKWVPEVGDVTNARKIYYTVKVGSTEYALVSMHVSSRQNPNWVWGTFEHQMNPGRCDYIGCYDTFGAQTGEVLPNKSEFNSQYGACKKTAQLSALMAEAGLPSVWENYCLKSSQVDFTATDKTPYVLGNSVIEGIVGNGTVAASSCISCHAYASFGADGLPTKSAMKILPFNPTGNPIQSVLAGSRTFAFMWGVAQLIPQETCSGKAQP